MAPMKTGKEPESRFVSGVTAKVEMGSPESGLGHSLLPTLALLVVVVYAREVDLDFDPYFVAYTAAIGLILELASAQSLKDSLSLLQHYIQAPTVHLRCTGRKTRIMMCGVIVVKCVPTMSLLMNHKML